MNDISYQNSAMESLAFQLQNAPGVTAVSIRSGRRGVDYGTPVGEPRASWSLGTGMTIEVWGDDSALVDALIELARLVDHRDQEIDDLAEALTQANDRQLRLFELSRLNVDSLDRALTIDRVLGHGIELTDSLCATFVSSDGVTKSLSAQADASCEWIEAAVRVAVSDGNLRKSVGARGNYVLLSPVTVGEARHVLALGRQDSVPFGTAERKVIDALAASLAAALSLVEMHESALKQAVTESEHRTAAELANTVLPKSVSSIPGINSFATCLPARSVGGDFFTSLVHQGKMRFVIGDVAGKGLPAAVLMTNAITVSNTVFRTEEATDAVQLLAAIHDSLESLLVGTNRFITMLVGIATVDPRRPGAVKLSLANAGHSPVILRVDGAIQAVPPCAPPVGVGFRPAGPGFDVELTGHDWLVTGSDGLLEQDGEHGDMFGQDRLEDLVRGDISAAALADRITAAVQQFGGTMPRSDDQTVFVLRPIGGPMKPASDEVLMNESADGAEGSMTHHDSNSSDNEPGSRRPAPEVSPLDDGRPRLLLEAELERVRELATWIPEAVRQVNGVAPDDVIGPIELSVHELCINITEHAYAKSAGHIDVSCTRRGSELVFELFDTGAGFDPTMVAEPDPSRPTVRGYGMMIIRQLASRVDYQREGDRNHWTISFALPAESAE